ncbi:type II secretion system F family protein [Georgenia sp. Z1491]|uniref:type II secretion system F family protein n=1 Tax=Georgenia sp. Z1491 TaxID=3416707 RepID=UPI003CF59FC9
MSPAMSGGVAGLLLAVGVWVVVARLGARRPRLADRLAPYLVERPTSSRLLAEAPARTPLTVVERLVAPVIDDVVPVLEKLGSTTTTVRRRLAEVGSTTTVAQFRTEQMVWGAIGLAAGLVVALTVGALRDAPAPILLLGVVLFGVGGAVMRDTHLTAQVARRRERLAAELPDIAELIALSVGAGEGLVPALERVQTVAHGAVADELRRTLAETRAGAPMIVALENLAGRTGSPALSRFADAVAGAVERGTPLAEVLRAQAQDARETTRRELMELAGKKEVAMMVPVVFFVLPTTVMFALFPGLAALRMGL